MKDVFDQMMEQSAACAGNQVIGGAMGVSARDEFSPAVLAAARNVHDALAGLPMRDAISALSLARRALDVSSVVQDRRGAVSLNQLAVDLAAQKRQFAGLTASEIEAAAARLASAQALVQGG